MKSESLKYINTEKWKAILDTAVSDGAFPCYAAAVGCGDEVFFRAIGGNRAVFPKPLPLTEDTLFDMASLSKLMGTTMAALRLIDQGKLRLTDRVGDFFENSYGKEDITIFQLMTHTSGIKAHFPLWLRGIDQKDAADEILREPFGYTPESNAVYTCMGYILLGRILEGIENQPLDKIVQKYVFDPLSMKNSFYNPPSDKPCAATEKSAATGKIICGSVHDENADFLKGISGNAGIFCDLDDCITFARTVANGGKGYLSEELFKAAVTNYTPQFEENRGLGFNIVGNRYGHTGFTGTSIYIGRESGVFAILLTNRVHPTRNNGKLFPIRNEWHRLIFGE
jgi:CubicO group peptidase (beta-lactamase class C family)